MNKENENPTLEAATTYIQRKWAPIPIPLGQKAPVIKQWTKLSLTEATAIEHFRKPSNIGVLLGEPSSGLVDVDLDCMEALDLADALLPSTRAIFGRASKPKSHLLYFADPIPGRSVKFVDENGGCIVELRSTGGQTIFPPSKHPSGETVSWDNNGEPSKVKLDELAASVRLLAAGVILLRHYPDQGTRNDYCLTVANILNRAGYDETTVADFILAIADVAGDEESRERLRTAQQSAKRVEEGGATRGLPFLAGIIGDDATKALGKILGADYRKPGRPSQSDQLFQAVESKLELWHTPDDIAYATFNVDEHREHRRVRSRSVRLWLIRTARNLDKKGVSRTAQDAILDMMEASALVGPEYEAELRVAEHEGELFIDLADDRWRAVRISRDGWQIADHPPVRFVRGQGMKALPDPQQGGSLNDLRAFVNIANDNDFLLLLGVIIGALRPAGPHVVAVVNGEQGSAKSTLVRVMRNLIDPNKSPTRAQPRSEEDLYVAAANSYLLSYDNLSYVNAAMSDAICRIATGGGFSKRQLYTDLDEIIMEVCRPVLLNGIPSLVERPDLMDRAIIFTLPRIGPEKRRTEAAFRVEFEQAQPQIFGAICEALSAGLRYRDEIVLGELPRMADLVIFMTAVERGLGLKEGGFATVYGSNLRSAMIDLAAMDPLVEAILKVIARKSFSGTASELLHKIREVLPDREGPPRGIPRLPNRLAGALRRLAPALREMGVEVVWPNERDTGNRRILKIHKIEEEPF